MPTALEELQGNVEELDAKWEAAVREYLDLPDHERGELKHSAKGKALCGYAMATFGWDYFKTRDDVSRIRRVMVHERIAGTKAERAEVAEALDKADADVKKRKPAIEKRIRELQAELGGLTSERDRLESQLAESTKSAQELTQLLPPHVNYQINALNRESRDLDRQGVEAIASDVRAEIAMLEKIIAGPEGFIDPNVRRSEETATARFAVWLIENGFEGHVEAIEHAPDPNGGRGRRIEYKLLPNFKTGLVPESKADLELARNSLAEAEKDVVAYDEKLAQLRQYYIK